MHPSTSGAHKNGADGDDTSARDVDLHVHTLSSNCGYTSAARLLDLTRRSGRKVVAVTDHDSAAGGVAVRDLAARTGDDVLVLVGMELSTSDLGHVIVFGRGVEDDWGWRSGSPFPRHIPDHWAAIMAHPFRGKVTVGEYGTTVAPVPVPAERIDAVEVWNGGDVLKKSRHLRAELDRLSRAYIEQHDKVAVASSDGHRAIWVHTFFTRFARPVTSAGDAVDQLRSGNVTPQAQDEPYLDASIRRWLRREVVEWHQKEPDWRDKAVEAGYTMEDAEARVQAFLRVRDMLRGGRTVDEIASAMGLEPEEALDLAEVIRDEADFAERRAARLAGLHAVQAVV